MTPWLCKYCTGTHYLGDNEALGPCVCVTPQTVTDLRNALTSERAAHNGLQLELLADPHSSTDIEVRRKAKLFDALFAAWDDYCVQQGVGADAAGLDRTVRNSRPAFTRLWDQMQEIRRGCE